MKFSYSVIVIISLGILGSCSIEKRLYNKGYSLLQRKSIRHSSHDEITEQPFFEQISSSQTEKYFTAIKPSVSSPADSIDKTPFLVTDKNKTVNVCSVENYPIVRDEIKTERFLSELKKVTKKPLTDRGSGRGSGLRLFVAAALCVLLGLTLVYNPGYYGFGLFFGFMLLAIGAILLFGAIIYVIFHGF